MRRRAFSALRSRFPSPVLPRRLADILRCSLGDSGFSIIRSSAVIYQQRVQQHFFNCPKYVTLAFIIWTPFGILTPAVHRQLSKLPTSTPRFSRACIDSPRDAETYETKLRDGDIVLAYVRSFLPTHTTVFLNYNRVSRYRRMVCQITYSRQSCSRYALSSPVNSRSLHH